MGSNPLLRGGWLVVAALGVALVALSGPQPAQARPLVPPSIKGHPPVYRPPHWAPANGYRRRHPAGIDLIFDRNMGVYSVSGYPQNYFYNGRFYRYRDDFWQASPYWKGPWGGIDLIDLPPGLRAYHVKHHLKQHLKHHRYKHR
jgi:hypothetical protein